MFLDYFFYSVRGCELWRVHGIFLYRVRGCEPRHIYRHRVRWMRCWVPQSLPDQMWCRQSDSSPSASLRECGLVDQMVYLHTLPC